MTTKRIDELTAATSLTAADLIPIMDEATTTKKITAANARPYMLPTAAETLALLVTVDGAGSGLDADLLDGNSSAAFATAAQGATADTAVQPARSISTTAPLTGGGDLSANRTLAVSAASDTASGVVELATTAETQTGTDATRAVTPAGAAATFAPLAHNQAASTITSGTLDTARLGSGSATSSTYLRGDQTWATISAGGGYAIFGDGSDGTVTISGTTTLTRDMFYDVLTVRSGGVLKTANYRVFCKTSCTVDAGGIIQNNGTDGTVARWGGAAPTAGTLGAGANGADGAVTNSNGNAGNATTLSFGGASGAGGAAASTYTGGAAGAATAPGATFGSARSLPTAITMKALSNGGTSTFTGGAGGAAGAAKTWNGGGGGSGAGVLVLVAKAITNNGTISANGGVGGQSNGGGSSDAGSGGGGGGGCVVLVYNTFTGSAATATGGAGGAAQGTGNAGSAGSNGTIITLVNA